MKYIMVITTCKDEHEAKYIAKELLTAKLAACIHDQKIRSFYMWEDSICEDLEVRLLIKTKYTHFEKIKKLITKRHSYELPQIIFTPIDGSKEYLRWVDNIVD